MFLDPDKHGKNLTSDAAQLLGELIAGESSKADISMLGDTVMLEQK